MNKFSNPWPPVHPIDEKRYNVELQDGSVKSDLEYWAFGGGFGRTAIKDGQLVEHPLSEVVSFELSS